MKAIETHYKGYRFRSRLEARWAVFFEAIGVRWRYETEGYDFSGFKYLPDFYLPDWDVFLEVKPDLPVGDYLEGDIGVSVFEQEANYGRPGYTVTGKFLIASASLYGWTERDGQKIGHQRLHMLCGTPGVPKLATKGGRWQLRDGAVAVSNVSPPSSDGRNRLGPVLTLDAFALTDGGRRLDLWPLYLEAFEGKWSGGILRGEPGEPLTQPVLPNERMMRFYIGNGVSYHHLDLIAAYRAARSARFEHGETPR